MEVAGIIALLGLAGTVGSLVYLHAAPTGLSPLRNPVSQYGITPFRGGYRAATLAFAVTGAALFWAVLQVGVPGRGKTFELLALAVFALARAAISWFPMDPPEGPHTDTGRRHGLLAVLAFAAIAVAARSMTPHLAPGMAAGWAATAGLLGLLLFLCLIAMVASVRVEALRRGFGAVERVFYLLAIAWCAMVAISLV